MSSVSAQTHWVRSSHGIIAGVCQALGERFGIAPWVLRLLWIMSVLLCGAGLILYFILTICLPRDDHWEQAQSRMILGVCARIARRGEVEIGIARLIAVFLLLFSAGAAIVGYIVLYFVLPDPNQSPLDPNQKTSIF